jgi:hypothetical protein
MSHMTASFVGLSGTLIALSINGGSPSRHERDLILKSFKEGHAFF